MHRTPRFFRSRLSDPRLPGEPAAVLDPARDPGAAARAPGPARGALAVEVRGEKRSEGILSMLRELLREWSLWLERQERLEAGVVPVPRPRREAEPEGAAGASEGRAGRG